MIKKTFVNLKVVNRMIKLQLFGESLTKKVLDTIKEKDLKEFTTKQMSELLGKSVVSVSVTLGDLTEKGILVKLSRGHYKKSDVELELVYKSERKKKEAPKQEEAK